MSLIPNLALQCSCTTLESGTVNHLRMGFQCTVQYALATIYNPILNYGGTSFVPCGTFRSYRVKQQYMRQR